jgi:G3E family GTPase
MSVPCIIVSGFLGGGKTTFLRYLLPICGRAGIRPVLIINEAGSIDVDGQLLADLGAEQRKLLGGCICCSLQADLDRAVQELVTQHQGDVILIECSGLSSPKDVLHALRPSRIQHLIQVTHIIGIVDAYRFQRVPMLVDLLRDQIMAADTILLNKWDILDQPQQQRAHERLHELATPDVNVYTTHYGHLDIHACMALLTEHA